MPHLRPTTELAPRVLLPGDPGRALALAQHLLDKPLMFNHAHGLWGYTGHAADGARLTIQSTGLGGPSAAIVLSELTDLGVERAIVLGTCAALEERVALGDLVVVDEAIPGDGASAALGGSGRIAGDEALTARLAAGLLTGPRGLVASSDLFYETAPERTSAWRETGALAVDLQAAALMQIGRQRGIAVGVVLAVTRTAVAGRRYEHIDDDALAGVMETMGDASVVALAT